MAPGHDDCCDAPQEPDAADRGDERAEGWGASVVAALSVALPGTITAADYELELRGSGGGGGDGGEAGGNDCSGSGDEGKDGDGGGGGGGGSNCDSGDGGGGGSDSDGIDSGSGGGGVGSADWEASIREEYDLGDGGDERTAKVMASIARNEHKLANAEIEDMHF